MEPQTETNPSSYTKDNTFFTGTEEMSIEKNLASGKRKKSFLVYMHNKYTVVPTEAIAFFYLKHETTVIVSFDKREYFVNYSLDQIQSVVSHLQFYRLNRQYLINFSAIKEVEHYFARKLLVNPTISFTDKLLVSKEKARNFLDWLENR